MVDPYARREIVEYAESRSPINTAHAPRLPGRPAINEIRPPDEGIKYREYAIEEYKPHVEPYYLPIANEVEMFTAAFEERIPVLLKGPTGCGKTRFVEYMAWQLAHELV